MVISIVTNLYKRTLVIKFHHTTCQTPEMRKIATHKFFDSYIKNVTWPTYLISFTVQYCFLFRLVCIELLSLIWVLQIWVAICVYGTMINWSSLIKKLLKMYIVIVSGSILYLSKPVLGGHPVLSGHYSIPRGCPLNTGFTVLRMPLGLGMR